jgi:putative transposase
MADDHRRPDAQTAQAILLDDADFLKEIIERVLQEVLEAEMTEHIAAAPYERTDARKGHRNGHKPRALRRRVGTLNLLVPQDREGTFSTKLFARYQRNEKALVLALMQMYLEGVSTRKVKDITEESCVAHLSPRASSLLWPVAWTPNSQPGGTDRWKRKAIPTCSWTPATRRSGWTLGW